MGYRCRKCGIACCSKQIKDIHEGECDDVTWSIHKKNINLYDHNYTSNIVVPSFRNSTYSNWNYISNVEHSYCTDIRSLNQTLEQCDIPKRIVSEDIVRKSDKRSQQLTLDHNYVIPNELRSRKKCVNCGRIYRYSISLDKHMISCRNRMNITCRTCGLICHSYKDLYAHKMNKHQKYDKESLQKTPWSREKDAPWSILPKNENEKMKKIYNQHRSIILAPNQISDIVSIYNMPCENNVNSDMIMNVVRDIYEQGQRTFKISFSAGLILQHIISGEYRYWRPYRNQEFFSDPFTISSRHDLEDLKEMLDTFNLHDYTLKQRPDTKYKCVMITNIQMFVFETNYTLGYEKLNLPGYLTHNIYVICFDKMLIGKYKRCYKDFLCAFRCIAYHKNASLYKTSRGAFELLTLKLFKKWQLFMNRKYGQYIESHNFKGISLDQIKYVEECFLLSIHIYEKIDKDTVIPIYKTEAVYSDTMYLNIYKKHLSYVSDFKRYTKKFKCDLCDKMFTTSYLLSRHSKICLVGCKIKFRGGFFNSNRSLWDELELFGLCIDSKDMKYTYFIVFDYECLLEKMRLELGESTKTDSVHKPISVSTCGNCCAKHRKPVCIVEEDFDILIQKWMVELEIIAKHIREKTMKKWGNILSSLNDLREELNPEKDSLNQDNDQDMLDIDNMESSDFEEPSEQMCKALKKENVYQRFMQKLKQDKWSVEYNDWSSEEEEEEEDKVEEVQFNIINETHFKNIDRGSQLKMFNQVTRLCDQMSEYINQVPVIGFHSSKYDLLIIRSQLIKQLGLHINKKKPKEKKKYYVIKRGESYPCIATASYKFLDITEYLGGHVSYAQFLRSMKVTTGRKLFFPFEAVTSFNDLQQGLPHMNSYLWFSSVKQKSLLDDGQDTIQNNYNLIKQKWDECNMKTLKDLLILYNNCDCGPFVTALESFQNIFHEQGINVFKSGVISAPGLSRKLLFSTADKQNIPITLFDAKNSDLYYSFKKQCYGGASIIFSRHHKVGQTFIRGNPEHICKSIFGIDGVALYLYCISQPMPVGFCIRRKENNNFKPEINDRAISTIYWLTWQNEYNNKHILHRYNTGGKERSFVNFKFDGWDSVEQKGYELYGCYFHGHKYVNKYCFVSKNMDSELAEKRYKQTKSRENYIKQHCKVHIIWECSYYNLVKSNKDLKKIINRSRPLFYNKYKGSVTPEQILKAVCSDKLFGFIEVDLTVNEQEKSECGEGGMNKYQYLMEMCPIFGTANIEEKHISGVMGTFMSDNNISKKPRRQLLGTLSGKQMMLHSSLLKFYLDIGLHVTHVYQVVEYVGNRVFKPFSDMIMKYRREASLDPEKAPLAQMFKVIGNSGMYYTHIYTYTYIYIYIYIYI